LITFMLVTCTHCNARLQLDESKVSHKISKARCPKCNGSVDITSPAPSESDPANQSLPADMVPPAPDISPFERPPVAAPFNSGEAVAATASGAPAEDAAKVLLELLRHNAPAVLPTGSHKRPAWDRRKALVCTDDVRREAVAKGLAGQDFEVYVAETTAEALGRMREDRMDVLVLESAFDPVEQGYAFVAREIKLLRPAERRRLFLVFVTETARTMDLHAAFLHNANLVVNPADIEKLPEALEVSLRHYNELYKDFNLALDVTPI
jgi:CheY-like chemotaxis protein